MDFMVDINIKKLVKPIRYGDKLLLIGSCFTEHIGNSLEELKFRVLQNPNGILFDPASVCRSIISYIQDKRYAEIELFQLHETWNSWQHHSRFSHVNKEAALQTINESQRQAHQFLKGADWVIVTLGSSFVYQLTEEAKKVTGFSGPVANCHRAPAQWFSKQLLTIDEIISMLDNCYHQLISLNPKVNVIFTVSPVRHIRDGVVENNRSKARLIESVHHLVNKFDGLYYFPAYELVVDVLRDYRFYDADMAHPNYMATNFVLEKFKENCVEEASQELMEEVRKIVIAKKHRPFQPETKAHREFLKSQFEKATVLAARYPFLDLEEEITYFKRGAWLEG